MTVDLSLFNEEQIEQVRISVEEAVKARVEIERQKQHIKDIASDIKENLEISTADFNTLVKDSFDNRISEEAEELSKREDNLEILYPKQSDCE